MIRTCAACQAQGDKYTFYRIARVNGIAVADPDGIATGRGVYVCRNVACMERLRKSKRADAVLKVPVPDEVYETLLRAIPNGETN